MNHCWVHYICILLFLSIDKSFFSLKMFSASASTNFDKKNSQGMTSAVPMPMSAFERGRIQETKKSPSSANSGGSGEDFRLIKLKKTDAVETIRRSDSEHKAVLPAKLNATKTVASKSLPKRENLKIQASKISSGEFEDFRSIELKSVPKVALDVSAVTGRPLDAGFGVALRVAPPMNETKIVHTIIPKVDLVTAEFIKPTKDESPEFFGRLQKPIQEFLATRTKPCQDSSSTKNISDNDDDDFGDDPLPVFAVNKFPSENIDFIDTTGNKFVSGEMDGSFGWFDKDNHFYPNSDSHTF